MRGPVGCPNCADRGWRIDCRAEDEFYSITGLTKCPRHLFAGIACVDIMARWVNGQQRVGGKRKMKSLS